MHLFSALGTYQVTLQVTSRIDCMVSTSSRTITILSLSPVQVDLGSDKIICLEEAIHLELSPKRDNLRWQDQSTEHFITVAEPGIYWVDVTTRICTRRDSIRITVQECMDDLQISNVFTQNGDDHNETFTLTGGKEISCNLAVFNRWGKGGS